MTTVILDPGHEGLSPGGLYLRRGKQSPQVPPGIYEGIFNREICQLVKGMCEFRRIPAVITNPGPINCTLAQRYNYVNQLHAIRQDCLLICIHANAAGRGKWQTKRNGCVVFHCKGASAKSISLAKSVFDNIGALTELRKDRINAKNFAMVKKTNCPAIYIEIGFMDNRKDAEYMASGSGKLAITQAIFNAINENL